MQSLSRVKKVSSTHWGDHPVLIMYPILGAKVAQCIASWSEIETLMGMFLGVILHANQAAALAMYSTVENRSAQMRMIEVASRENLTSLESDLFSVLIKRKIRPAMKKRDRLAHWTWGYTDEIENSFLIRDPSHSLNNYASLVNKGVTEGIPADYSQIFVVREPDLDGYLSQFKDVNHCVRIAISSVLETNSRQLRDIYLRKLLGRVFS